jgi:hypothetical protein
MVDRAPAVFRPVPDPEPDPWHADFLLGLPTGFRLQRLLCPVGNGGLEAEGVAGLYLILPALGGGLRWHGTPLCGEHDALVFSPGVDAYLLVNPFAFGSGWFSGGPKFGGLVGGDVDVTWEHHFSNHCASELGLQLGAGVGWASRATALPLASLILGFSF